jgi:hypothetical protein
MALSVDEQKLFDLALAVLPHWFQENKRAMEHLGLSAKEAGAAWLQLIDWMDNTLILQAVGPTGFDPDWLNQHAIDRGTTRQAGETDEALRERIRNVPDLLTRPVLLDAAQAIVDAEGVSVTVPVEFVSAVNVTVSTNNITKNGGGAAWNAGAISQERIMLGEDGYVQFAVGQNDKSVICGLNYRSTGVTRSEIDFGIQTDAAGTIKIFESGVQRGTTYGTYTAADEFRVSVDSGVVTYWHGVSGDWTLLYTSAVAPSYPLRVDASIYDVGSSIEDVEIVQVVRMVELRRDKAYIGSFTEMSGTGGTFAGTAPDMKFTPSTLPWARPPLVLDPPPFKYQLVFSGSDEAGNDGTFLSTGLDGDAVEFQNASGVADVDAGVTWKAQKLDQDGNLADGFARAFISRGYRIGHGVPNTIIVILPLGSTAATVASVEEMLRQKKGAGIRHYVERRVNP